MIWSVILSLLLDWRRAVIGGEEVLLATQVGLAEGLFIRVAVLRVRAGPALSFSAS